MQSCGVLRDAASLPALPPWAVGEKPARCVTVVFLPAFFTVPASRGAWIVQPYPRLIGPLWQSC